MEFLVWVQFHLLSETFISVRSDKRQITTKLRFRFPLIWLHLNWLKLLYFNWIRVTMTFAFEFSLPLLKYFAETIRSLHLTLIVACCWLIFGILHLLFFSFQAAFESKYLFWLIKRVPMCLYTSSSFFTSFPLHICFYFRFFRNSQMRSPIGCFVRFSAIHWYSRRNKLFASSHIRWSN